MSPVQRLLIGVIVMLGGVAGFVSGRVGFRPTEQVVQPIAFGHHKHVEELGLECETCHELFATADHSGLPTLETCLACHEDALTDLPEEQKIRDLAARGENDVFRKLFRMPDHTFYSHRRHVTIGGLDCETCHGSVAATTTPPERPLIRITMEFCVECHERTGASSECTRCHR